MASPVSWPSIQAEMDRIRAGSRGRSFTNCFGAPGPDELRLLAGEESIVFAAEEPGRSFERLYYLTAHPEELQSLLASMNRTRRQVIAYVDRSRNATLCNAFRSSGFVELACYERLTHSSLEADAGPLAGSLAAADDVEGLSSLLEGTFDPATDYLPDAVRIRRWVEDGRAIVRRTNGRITGAVVFQCVGRQVNFNYFVNAGPKGEGRLLMADFLRCVAARGIRSGFLWVDERNESAKRFYEGWGWKHDGLRDWFFHRLPEPS